MLTDEEKREIWDSIPNNYTNWYEYANAIERAVLAKSISQQERLYKEWSELWSPIDDAVRPLTLLGESVAAKAIELINLAKAMPIPKQEPVENPHEWIIEKLSYHRYERNDLNIEGCLKYLESEWKEIQGRTTRQLIMQILSLLAQPVPAQSAAIPESFVEAFDHILELLEYVTDQPVIIPEPTDSTIMRNVKKIVIKLRSLSASPKPE